MYYWIIPQCLYWHHLFIFFYVTLYTGHINLVEFLGHPLGGGKEPHVCVRCHEDRRTSGSLPWEHKNKKKSAVAGRDFSWTFTRARHDVAVLLSRYWCVDVLGLGAACRVHSVPWRQACTETSSSGCRDSTCLFTPRTCAGKHGAHTPGPDNVTYGLTTAP